MLCCVVRITVQNCFIPLSSLEIIDRTKYVNLILHEHFYNLYLIVLRQANLKKQEVLGEIFKKRDFFYVHSIMHRQQTPSVRY
jgi:hypothetical protein